MIEEEVCVAEVSKDAIWVVKNRSSGCSACSNPCSSSLASGLFSAKPIRLRLNSNLLLNPGDRVMLGIDDDSLARASLAVYLLPLLGFFLGLLFGISLFGSELAGGLTGLLGLGVCFVGIRFFGPFGQASCQPVILRKIN